MSRTIDTVALFVALGALAGCNEPAPHPLDVFPSPADYGCETAFTRHSSIATAVDEAGQSCNAAEPLAMRDLFALTAWYPDSDDWAAWRDGERPLPMCSFTGGGYTQVDERDDCEYHFRALVGVIEEDEMVIDFEVHIESGPDSCWTETCDFTLRRYWYTTSGGLD